MTGAITRAILNRCPVGPAIVARVLEALARATVAGPITEAVRCPTCKGRKLLRDDCSTCTELGTVDVVVCLGQALDPAVAS